MCKAVTDLDAKLAPNLAQAGCGLATGNERALLAWLSHRASLPLMRS